MSDFPIYHDKDSSHDVAAAAPPVFKHPAAPVGTGKGGKDARPRQLMNSGQKQPSSWKSTSSKPSLAKGDIRIAWSQSVSVFQPNTLASSRSSAQNLNNTARSSDLSFKEKIAARRPRDLKSIDEFLDKQPEEFFTIPVVGREPNIFEECGYFALTPEQAARYLEQSWEDPDLDQCFPVKNVDDFED